MGSVHRVMAEIDRASVMGNVVDALAKLATRALPLRRVSSLRLSTVPPRRELFPDDLRRTTFAVPTTIQANLRRHRDTHRECRHTREEERLEKHDTILRERERCELLISGARLGSEFSRGCLTP